MTRSQRRFQRLLFAATALIAAGVVMLVVWHYHPPHGRCEVNGLTYVLHADGRLDLWPDGECLDRYYDFRLVWSFWLAILGTVVGTMCWSAATDIARAGRTDEGLRRSPPD